MNNKTKSGTTPITSLRISVEDKERLQKKADRYFKGNLTKLLIEAGKKYKPQKSEY